MVFQHMYVSASTAQHGTNGEMLNLRKHRGAGSWTSQSVRMASEEVQQRFRMLIAFMDGCSATR